MRNFRLRNVRFRPLFAIGALLGALLLIQQSQSTPSFSQKLTQNPSGSSSGLGFTTVRKGKILTKFENTIKLFFFEIDKN